VTREELLSLSGSLADANNVGGVQRQSLTQKRLCIGRVLQIEWEVKEQAKVGYWKSEEKTPPKLSLGGALHEQSKVGSRRSEEKPPNSELRA
jgi:hypothetical protein